MKLNAIPWNSNGQPVMLNIDSVAPGTQFIVEILYNPFNGRDEPTVLEIHHLAKPDDLFQSVAESLDELSFLDNGKHTITLVFP